MKKSVGFVALFIMTLLVGFGSADSAGNITKTPAEHYKDIVDTARAAEYYEILVNAIHMAKLDDTLKGKGPFTVFAPDDAAFAKIKAADLDALFANKTALTKVLTYHVVPGKIMSKDLKDGMNLKTVEGEDLTIKITPTGVMVDNATVTKADIETSNGVIHAIDAVVMPK
ncbi:MAG: fasciclin domain-containing protein [Methanotrichaceae archaeon]|nr:fasciclin domain-containing protein [Methanotrichaceae archaeon]